MARKVSKKQRRSKSRRATRKMRGGYYSFNGAVGTGAPNYTSHTEVPVMSGGRKKRKGATRHRKMKGGGSYGGVSASFQGSGVSGMANYSPVSTIGPYSHGGAAGGAFNNAAK